jgi:hypothetical protein
MPLNHTFDRSVSLFEPVLLSGMAKMQTVSTMSSHRARHCTGCEC